MIDRMINPPGGPGPVDGPLSHCNVAVEAALVELIWDPLP
jgi:hypothetical protein